MTSVALVLAPLTCSLVLLLSGLAKLRDPAASREAFASMGVPAALRSEAVVRLHPYAEVALGVLLLVTWSWAMAVVAAAVTLLFAAYWVLVLLVLRRGEEVDCGCFGAIGDDRVSGTTLARNSLLVLLAALATAYGVAGSGVPDVVRDLRGEDALWVVMAAAAALTAVLVVGRGRPAPAGPSVVPAADEDLLDYEREPIPFAMLLDREGQQTTLRALASQQAQLLVFLSPSCSQCAEVAAQMPGWAEQLGPVGLQAVYTEQLSLLPDAVVPAGVPAWFDVARGATDTFAPTGRPAAVLLGADGMLAGGPVAGSPLVVGFAEDVLAEIAEALDAPGAADHTGLAH